MNSLDTTRIVARVISEVGGTIATNGIHELDRTERGGMSAYLYVRGCLLSTAYNSVRAMHGFGMSYEAFCKSALAVADADRKAAA